MGKRSKKYSISDMYCCKCGNKNFGIGRKSTQHREPGHLKKIYCTHCKQVWNHVEIRPIFNDYNYEDFKLEIKYHNFDENGNRKKPYRIFRGNLKQKGVV